VSPAVEAIAYNVAEEPWWRWLPGMLEHLGGRVLEVHADGSITTSEQRLQGFGYSRHEEHATYTAAEARHMSPDLDDPATLLLVASLDTPFPDPLAVIASLRGGDL